MSTAVRMKAWLLLPVSSFVALTCVGSGCEPSRPQPSHIAEMNQLVVARTGEASFEVGGLLQDDPWQETAPPSGILTLEEAVRRALAHNSALAAAAESLTIARAQVAQASLIQNPTLAQSSGLLFPFYSHALPTFDINISQTLNSILTQPSRVRVARLQELQAQIDLATQAFTLLQSATSKYQELTHILRSQRIAQEIVRNYKWAVDAAEARRQVGLITLPELNRARVNYLDAVRQVHHLQTQYARAAQEMNWLMGYTSPPQWTVPADALRPPPQLPPAPPLSVLQSLGRAYRLDLGRAQFDRQLGDFGVNLARVGLFPQLSVGGEFAHQSHRWVGGPFFSLQLPIFDPGLVALELAQDNQRKAYKSYRALEGQVSQDVQAAVANYQIAEDDLNFFRTQLIPQQRQSVQLMRDSFRLGNDDLDALLNALHDYVNVLQNFEDATTAYQSSSTAVQSAVGLTWAQMNRLATATGVPPAARTTPNSPAAPTTTESDDWLFGPVQQSPLGDDADRPGRTSQSSQPPSGPTSPSTRASQEPTP